jgi:hypothetical protein
MLTLRFASKPHRSTQNQLILDRIRYGFSDADYGEIAKVPYDPERTVFVTESEYKAIQQFEDDGAAPIDIIHVIVPDVDVEQESQESPPVT